MTSSTYTKRRALPSSLTLILLLSVVSGGRAQSNPVLSGLVTDGFGAVIPDTVIVLYSPDRLLKTNTNQEGRFAFNNAPPGKYQIEASRPGFKTKTIAVVQSGNKDAKPLSITLAVASTGDCGSLDGSISYGQPSAAGSGKLAVKVLDSGARPLAKASVSLTRTSAARAQFSQRTNENGEFRFRSLEAGQYVLKVSHPGYYVAQTGTFWITHENQTTVVMNMLKQGLIRICE